MTLKGQDRIIDVLNDQSTIVIKRLGKYANSHKAGIRTTCTQTKLSHNLVQLKPKVE